MTTYAVLCIPGHGHVNPTLAVAQELVARGERVFYYLSEEFRLTVEATGATFRLYESEAWKKYLPQLATSLADKGSPINNASLGKRIGLMATVAIESIRELPALIAQMATDQVDCILYDSTFMQAVFLSDALHVPAVKLFATFAVSDQVVRQMYGKEREVDRSFVKEFFGALDEKLAYQCELYGVPPRTIQELLSRIEQLNIVFLPRAFQPAGETFDEKFVFVGPALPAQRYYGGDFPLERLDQRPLLYISLGTAYNNRLDFYQTCFEAFAGTEWQVVLAYGKRVNSADLGETPDNFLIAPHVPQLEILSRADLFISHGGMNSTMESLSFGVPLVVVPQMWEQEMNGRRVQELGLGLSLDRDTITGESLRAAVEQIAHDSGVHTRLQSMQSEIHQAGGYQRAADAIKQHVQARV
ncbi:putative UDP-glucosyltransferase YjiC [Reticulibacter mediterranei]|uniref:Putative UDP-glucosyltransferase YjiC n=1 Tax=Reticulibacter mediterranei TaxID=2778369 RepID=A0A8J3IUL5_9CHLR|nr:macrolide family glycosyltransferase [Reticulibacter mediterranei]GHO97062.1 putative UDP-glucosyltransferase YjiC [Reticulibacter mediterranei]